MFPSNQNGPRVLYDVLLPYLTQAPLATTVDIATSPWVAPAFGGARALAVGA